MSETREVAEHNGYSIWLAEDGMFEAMTEQGKIRKGSLASLKKALSAPAVRLEVMYSSWRADGGRLRHDFVIGTRKKPGSRYSNPANVLVCEEDGETNSDMRLYLPNDEAEDKLVAINTELQAEQDRHQKARRVLDDKKQAVLDSLTRVTPENYRELAAQQNAKHE